MRNFVATVLMPLAALKLLVNAPFNRSIRRCNSPNAACGIEIALPFWQGFFFANNAGFNA